jgi:FAD/FMN-containing dehydrogenase
MSVAGEIRKFFKGDIEVSAEVRNEYSRDASLFRIQPRVVVFPKNTEDVCRLVSYVAEKKRRGENISLTARSGGTDMTGGPLTDSIVLVFTRYMNRLTGLLGDRAVVEPGMYYRDFDKETKKHNLILPSYPASREICALGGMVANNAGGEKNLKYGKTEKYVEQVTAVLRDGKTHKFKALTLQELEHKKQEDSLEGEIYTKMHSLITKNKEVIKKAKPAVSKNSSGYYLWNVLNEKEETFDLSKILVGSQGTLGIITSATVRLVQPNPHSALVIMFLYDMKKLGNVINFVMRHNPESFESYDDNTFKLAVKFFPEFAAHLKSNIFKMAFSFIPEAWLMLTGGVPKLVMLAEFTSETKEGAQKQAERVKIEVVKKFGVRAKIARSNTEAAKYWAMRRESFNLLRKRVRGLRTAPFIDDLVVAPEYLPEFLPKLEAIVSEYKSMIYTVAGHMGDGNFHIIPLMDPKDKTMKQTIREAARRVYDLVLSYHGSISGEHNDGIIRGPYVADMFGADMYQLFEETKNIFDPDGIFNPGKKVGVTIENMFTHLDVPVQKNE